MTDILLFSSQCQYKRREVLMNKRKRQISCFFLIGFLFFGLLNLAFSFDIIPRSQYLNYARASSDWVWEHYDQIIEKWKQSFDPESVFGYRPPGSLLEMAVIYSFLYEQEKRPEYEKRVRKVSKCGKTSIERDLV